jgi:hypothetical protein
VWETLCVEDWWRTIDRSKSKYWGGGGGTFATSLAVMELNPCFHGVRSSTLLFRGWLLRFPTCELVACFKCMEFTSWKNLNTWWEVACLWFSAYFPKVVLCNFHAFCVPVSLWIPPPPSPLYCEFGIVLPKQILKGSDGGVSHSELLGFWTFSIVRYSRN